MTGLRLAGLTGAVDGFRLGPIDLDLPEDGTLAIIGPSGAGKTTLLRAVAGLLEGVGGRVEHDGTEISRAAPERRGLVYVPQGLGLFPHLSVRDNVGYVADLRRDLTARAEVPALLERFGLTELAPRRPSTLSGGEQQRVAIARALAARPRLLLWDEPLAALDLLARDELLRGLVELRRSARLSLLLVSHDPSIAFALADRFLVLDHGRPVFVGEPRALAEAPPNRFAARFVGYENVYGPDDLTRVVEPELLRWLMAHQGPDGIGLPTPAIRSDGPWSATIRSVRPGPEGPRYTGEASGLSVRLAGARGEAFRAGDRVRFGFDERSAVPLADPSGGGR